MAKILYSIAKEGMGHAIRAEVIIKELSKKHDVLLLCGERQYEYLSKFLKKIIIIDDFDLIYINNSVSFPLTLLRNFFRSPFIIYSLLKNLKYIKKFKPDVIISDFDPLSNYLSYFIGKPLISLDNQHVSTKCKINVPERFKEDNFISSVVLSSIITNADYYLITSYFFPKVKDKNVFLFPPIIRDKIKKAKIVSKDHIIVYQTSDSYKKLVDVLKNTKFNYIFYGNKSGKEGNVIFKKFCEDEFIRDLASCKAIITNGGFQLISEAIYLGKPVLSIPIKHQFEQVLNAIYLKKLGYGKYYLDISEKKIEEFIKNINKYKIGLRKFKKEDNSKVLKIIEDFIHKDENY